MGQCCCCNRLLKRLRVSSPPSTPALVSHRRVLRRTVHLEEGDALIAIANVEFPATGFEGSVDVEDEDAENADERRRHVKQQMEQRRLVWPDNEEDTELHVMAHQRLFPQRYRSAPRTLAGDWRRGHTRVNRWAEIRGCVIATVLTDVYLASDDVCSSPVLRGHPSFSVSVASSVQDSMRHVEEEAAEVKRPGLTRHDLAGEVAEMYDITRVGVESATPPPPPLQLSIATRRQGIVLSHASYSPTSMSTTATTSRTSIAIPSLTHTLSPSTVSRVLPYTIRPPPRRRRVAYSYCSMDLDCTHTAWNSVEYLTPPDAFSTLRRRRSNKQLFLYVLTHPSCWVCVCASWLSQTCLSCVQLPEHAMFAVRFPDHSDLCVLFPPCAAEYTQGVNESRGDYIARLVEFACDYLPAGLRVAATSGHGEPLDSGEAVVRTAVYIVPHYVIPPPHLNSTRRETLGPRAKHFFGRLTRTWTLPMFSWLRREEEAAADVGTRDAVRDLSDASHTTNNVRVRGTAHAPRKTARSARWSGLFRRSSSSSISRATDSVASMAVDIMPSTPRASDEELKFSRNHGFFVFRNGCGAYDEFQCRQLCRLTLESVVVRVCKALAQADGARELESLRGLEYTEVLDVLLQAFQYLQAGVASEQLVADWLWKRWGSDNIDDNMLPDSDTKEPQDNYTGNHEMTPDSSENANTCINDPPDATTHDGIAPFQAHSILTTLRPSNVQYAKHLHYGKLLANACSIVYRGVLTDQLFDHVVPAACLLLRFPNPAWVPQMLQLMEHVLVALEEDRARRIRGEHVEEPTLTSYLHTHSAQCGRVLVEFFRVGCEQLPPGSAIRSELPRRWRAMFRREIQPACARLYSHEWEGEAQDVAETLWNACREDLLSEHISLRQRAIRGLTQILTESAEWSGMRAELKTARTVLACARAVEGGVANC